MSDSQNNIGLKAKDIAIAYLLLRILIGVNYFNHGFTRIFNIPGFAEDTVKQLANSYFPEFLVRINSYLVPPVELIVGVLITIGLATRSALIATFILMIVLMMGVTSVQNWSAATAQLTYGIVLFILLAGNNFNIFSLDRWLNNKRSGATSSEHRGQSTANFINNFLTRRKRHKRSSTYTNFR